MSMSEEEIKIKKVTDRLDPRFDQLEKRVKALKRLPGEELFKKWGIRGQLKVSMSNSDIIKLQREIKSLNEECAALEAQLNVEQIKDLSRKKTFDDWVNLKKLELEMNKRDIQELLQAVAVRLGGQQGKRIKPIEIKDGAEEKKLIEEDGIKDLENRCKFFEDRSQYGEGQLIDMASAEFSSFKRDISDLSREADRLLSLVKGKIPDHLAALAVRIDKLSSYVVDIERQRSLFSRAYYGIRGTPIPPLGEKYWLLRKQDEFAAAVAREKKKIQDEREQKMIKDFEAASDATIGAKAGVEGRRWGTTYLLTREQAEVLRRKRDAYDEVRATLNVCRSKEFGLQDKEAYVTLKHFVKTLSVGAQELVEQTIGNTGQAILVGLGGPVYAGLILAWNTAFEGLEGLGNLLSGIAARGDRFAEEGIMKLFGEVAKKDESVDWSRGNIVKNIGLGFLHALRAPLWIPKVVFSGVAAVTKSVNEKIGNFVKKNLIPLLGIGGTAIAVYFIAITVASVFTLGIPLAVTVVGLAAAMAGAAIATYLKTKSKVKETMELRLPPHEEAMLMRYEYEQRQKKGTGVEGPKVQEELRVRVQSVVREAAALLPPESTAEPVNDPSRAKDEVQRVAISVAASKPGPVASEGVEHKVERDRPKLS